MKAIINKPHGKPGGMLIKHDELIQDFRNIAKYFKTSPKELEAIFKDCGYNVFNPKWKKFVEEVHNR